MTTTSGKFKALAERIGQLVDEKNQAYGNSFDDCGQFLKLLYPNGIPTDKFGDMLCIVRIFDKLKRIATKKDAFGESPYGDIVGYGLLGLEKDERGHKDLERLQARLEEMAARVDAVEKEEKVSYEDEAPSASIWVPPTGTASPEDKEPAEAVCAFCKTQINGVTKGMLKALSKEQVNKLAHEACFLEQQQKSVEKS